MLGLIQAIKYDLYAYNSYFVICPSKYRNIEYGCAAIRHRYQKNYDSQYNEYGQYQK